MVEVVQLDRGGEVSPPELAGIVATTTGTSQRSYGHNAMILFFNLTAGTGTWTIKIQSKMIGSDTYMDHYDNAGNLMAMSAITASRSQFFTGIPYDFKIVATEDVNGATVSVAYELITV